MLEVNELRQEDWKIGVSLMLCCAVRCYGVNRCLQGKLAGATGEEGATQQKLYFAFAFALETVTWCLTGE